MQEESEDEDEGGGEDEEPKPLAILWANVPGQKGQVFLDGLGGKIVQVGREEAEQYYNSAEATKFYMGKLGCAAKELPKKARLCVIELQGPESDKVEELAALPVDLAFVKGKVSLKELNAVMVVLTLAVAAHRHLLCPRLEGQGAQASPGGQGAQGAQGGQGAQAFTTQGVALTGSLVLWHLWLLWLLWPTGSVALWLSGSAWLVAAEGRSQRCMRGTWSCWGSSCS